MGSGSGPPNDGGDDGNEGGGGPSDPFEPGLPYDSAYENLAHYSIDDLLRLRSAIYQAYYAEADASVRKSKDENTSGNKLRSGKRGGRRNESSVPTVNLKKFRGPNASASDFRQPRAVIPGTTRNNYLNCRDRWTANRTHSFIIRMLKRFRTEELGSHSARVKQWRMEQARLQATTVAAPPQDIDFAHNVAMRGKGYEEDGRQTASLLNRIFAPVQAVTPGVAAQPQNNMQGEEVLKSVLQYSRETGSTTVVQAAVPIVPSSVQEPEYVYAVSETRRPPQPPQNGILRRR